ncbi:leucyl/phenylalanyl-tRNA--protein transferase [Pseudoprimorskyibacter insulae]|uniref:Leucyl/phenylalanyl-tRNA--protein transferase n=1 Tax=Pseudoprimorskyibacter insulae TaxID=1695997 RepID=A0A2R8B1L3_9RHOB|nr:leucyl/phenylalanyl-tRNA--protein transferase [Pseudoprimorskyibacter insulae]SPF82064.1 Leucyl/phenylalanyl-tRNA--protein transferase [Pseudoprimorskyibacter insulae]
MTELTPEIILAAYRAGVFPMSDHRDDPEVFWVEPRFRGVIPLQGFHISRSLARRLRRDEFTITLNTAFDAVMDGCAARDRTWINAPIRDVFNSLHAMGHSHSLEVWAQDGRLAGGIYGLAIGGAFFGESMFSRQTDASKVALAWMVTHLRGCGFQLFDTQFLTDHLASLGAKEIPRKRYLGRLAIALTVDASISGQPLPDSGQMVVQRNTQTS